MKKRNIFLSWLLILVMMISTFLMPAAEVQAVVLSSGYDTDDPKGFYDLMIKNRDKAVFENHNIYFTTKAKLANYSAYSVGTSSRATKITYQSIGYTIDVTNGTYNLQIEIDKYGDYFTRINRFVDTGNIEYVINAINYDDIVKLCKARYGESNAAYQSVFSSAYIGITCNAIMRVNLNGEAQGGLTGNANGTVTDWGTVYRLREPSDYYAFMNWGWSSANAFSSYMEIFAEVPNSSLTLNYYVDTKANAPSYSSVSNGAFTGSSRPTSTAATLSSGVNYSITNTGKISGLEQKYTSVRQFQSIAIRTTSNLGLSKKGYRLITGEEWKDDNGNVFKAGNTYTSSQINWAVTGANATTNLYANWKPITYTLKYDANGGTGSMNNETHTYDEEYFRIKEPAFTRKGYTFTGWKLYDANGNVVTLTDAMIKSNTSSNLFSKAMGELGVGAYVRNLTASHGTTLTLKAQWKANEYHFTLNAQPPAGKTIANYTTNFYSLFNTRFSLTSGGSGISAVTVPSITGYKFLGYFEGTNSTTPLISSGGIINFANTLYDQDKTFLGRWEPVKVTLTLDANTTSTGAAATPATQSLTATYDLDMPEATLPSKPGFTFKGFYTEKEGKGTQYYNNVMVSQRKSPFTSNMTLYAYWLDENKPSAVIEMESSTWTNSGDNTAIGQNGDGVYKVTFNAQDIASGINTMEIYRENDNGTFNLIKTVQGYGNRNVTYVYDETEEGATRFKVKTTDMSGNVSAEYYATCYYDKSSPTIFKDESSYNIDNLSNVSATIYATDSRLE